MITKTDLENYLYKTYDKVDEVEELLVSAKAKKWLDEHNIKYTERHIVEVNPTYDELMECW